MPRFNWTDLNFWKTDAWEHIQQKIIITPKCSPDLDKIFRAFLLTPFQKVRVVILGQDPYPNPLIATGLAFSIPKNCRMPPTLGNIAQELEDDTGDEMKHGDLTAWAKQGVLLLNRYLTCESMKTLSHSQIGWQGLTEEVVRTLCLMRPQTVFVLWGKDAQSVKSLFDFQTQYIESSHPSAMGANKMAPIPFIGSKPFSKINQMLRNVGEMPIDWRIF